VRQNALYILERTWEKPSGYASGGEPAKLRAQEGVGVNLDLNTKTLYVQDRVFVFREGWQRWINSSHSADQCSTILAVCAFRL
jgi:hypothetical protein